MRRFLPVVLLTLVVAACSDGSVNVEPEEDFQPDFGLNNEGFEPESPFFFFLPPLAPEPTGGVGEFDPKLTLEVHVCLLASGDCAGTVATILAKLNLNDSQYHANWKTEKSDGGKDFRISAVHDDDPEFVVLGSVDVHLRGKGGSGSDPKAGSTIPVKFFVGGGFVPVVSVMVSDETGGQIVVSDAGGDVVTVVDLPPKYSPDGVDRIVSVECNAIGVTTPGTGPLPTVLRQWPLFCDYTLTPPLAEGEEFREDVLVAVCQVDDAVPGQTAFHGFIRSELLLVQSDGPPDGPPDFQIPRQAAGTSLGNCEGAETPIALGGPNGFWGTLRSLGRTAAMRAVGPRPLHAAPMFYFGDGGIGALVRSFSLFGSVELFADSFEDDFFTWDQDGFWHTSELLGPANAALSGGFVSPAQGDLFAGALPLPGAFDFSRWFGEESTGNYMGEQIAGDSPLSGGRSTGARSGTMSTPAFRMPNTDDDATLQFLYWFEIESVNPSSYDLMDILVEDVDAATTISLGVLNPGSDPTDDHTPDQPFTSGGFDEPPVWKSACIDMNDFRTKNVRIHFDFDTVDGLYNGFRGWIVDAVQITQGTCPSMAPSLAEWSAPGGLRPKGPPGTRDGGN